MKKIFALLCLIFIFTLSCCTKNDTYIETYILSINKYGNINLKITPNEMRKKGFEEADMIYVEIGKSNIIMPIGTVYNDVDSGNPICTFKIDSKTNEEETVLAINSGNFASFMGIATINIVNNDKGFEVVYNEGFNEESKVIIKMNQKSGYKEEYELHKIINPRTNKREDYENLNDEEYANFRKLNSNLNIYRSSSPINPIINRNKEADKAILDNNIKTIINMADNESDMLNYDGYKETNYSKCKIIALNMGMLYSEKDFEDKLLLAFRFIINNEGPYLIHCREGKDRTGFLSAIIEALAGMNIDEIIDDYMITYYNFNKITKDDSNYLKISNSNILSSLKFAFNLNSIDELKNINLKDESIKYLKRIGLEDYEINSLKNRLNIIDESTKRLSDYYSWTKNLKKEDIIKVEIEIESLGTGPNTIIKNYVSENELDITYNYSLLNSLVYMKKKEPVDGGSKMKLIFYTNSDSFEIEIINDSFQYVNGISYYILEKPKIEYPIS